MRIFTMLPTTSTLLVLIASSTTDAALTHKGVDWSSLLVEEAAGKTYQDSAGTPQPLESILQSSGVNTVRQRLWNNPSDGNYNLDYNIQLARRAHAADLSIYLDFHFSDTWADPSHQTTPSAWSAYDMDDLAYAVYNYTLDTMNAFVSASVPLSLVSIGNEITAGMLWPFGSIEDSPYNLAQLLHSASAGIKDSSISPVPEILIHLDNGWDFDTQEWWYDSILAEGPLTAEDYDVQAVSYYPFYDSAATLEILETSLQSLVGKYGKEVMVVETNWPQSCPSPDYEFPSDTEDIPFSAEGQRTWMEDVASVVEGAGGNGLFYWEPAWLDNAGLGSSCDNNLMFDSDGRALSSLAVFESL